MLPSDRTRSRSPSFPEQRERCARLSEDTRFAPDPPAIRSGQGERRFRGGRPVSPDSSLVPSPAGVRTPPRPASTNRLQLQNGNSPTQRGHRSRDPAVPPQARMPRRPDEVLHPSHGARRQGHAIDLRLISEPSHEEPDARASGSAGAGFGNDFRPLGFIRPKHLFRRRKGFTSDPCRRRVCQPSGTARRTGTC